MVFALFDRVKETTTVTGTGDATLLGAQPGFIDFASVYADSDIFYYAIQSQTPGEWEVGFGKYVNPTIQRTTVIASSNGLATPCTFSAGTKDVFVTLPASKVLHVNDELATMLPIAVQTPAAGAAGFSQLYPLRKSRVMLHTLNEAGVEEALHPSLFKQVVQWLPGSATTASIAYGRIWTVDTTQAHPVLAATNLHTSMSRASFTTPATANTTSGVRASAVSFLRGNIANMGGFTFYARFGIAAINATAQVLVGMSNTLTALAAEPSTLAHSVFIGKDSTDTNVQLMFVSGVGVTKVNLGFAFAVDQIFEVRFHCDPNSSTITAYVKRLDTGAILVNNTVHNLNLPNPGTIIGPRASIRTTTASSVSLTLGQIYVEAGL